VMCRSSRLAAPSCLGPRVLDGDRQFADAAAGGMEDGVGDGGGDADLADLADALEAKRVDHLVADLDELHLDVGRVGVDRDQVLAQAGVGPAARPCVHAGALQQGLAEPPQHPAHELAAGRLGVQDAAGREGAEQAPHPDQAEVGVDRDLGELGPEGRRRIPGIGAGGVPASQRVDLFQEVAAQQLGVGLPAVGLVAEDHPPVAHQHGAWVGAVQRGLGIGDGPGDELVAQGGRGGVDRGADHARAR
jgi:hypothetical protein